MRDLALEGRGCLPSVRMSTGNKDTGLFSSGLSCYGFWRPEAVEGTACHYDPAQPLAPQIQVMLELREG